MFRHATTNTYVFIVCNCGVSDRQFLAAFSDFNSATQYASKKCGEYDDMIVYKHLIDSKEVGEVVYQIQTSTLRVKG